MGSHSLRKGGATTLFAATGNMELVKRFGGWKSDAVHAYLYADLHGGEQHGTRMLRSKPALQPQQRSRSTPAQARHHLAADCRAGCNVSDVPSLLCTSPNACPQDDVPDRSTRHLSTVGPLERAATASKSTGVHTEMGSTMGYVKRLLRASSRLRESPDYPEPVLALLKIGVPPRPPSL